MGVKQMRSTFDSSRIFNDQDGWYVVMRESDEKNLLGLPKHKVIGEQHLMGPFISKLQTEEWLEGFLAIHFVNRNPEVSTINIQH